MNCYKCSVFMYSWASPMIKVCHRRDAKRRVLRIEFAKPVNKFIMQRNPDFVFRLLFPRVHSPSIHFCQENELRSLPLMIALNMTEGTMTSFDHERFQQDWRHDSRGGGD